MKNKFKYIILAVVVVSGIIMQACQEGSIYPVYPVDNGGSVIDSGYYPYTAGSYWVYQLTYLSSEKRFVDTAKSTIDYSFLQNDGSRIININFSYMGFNYPLTELLNNKSVSRINPFSNFDIKEELRLPFTVGDTSFSYFKMFNDSIYTERTGIIRTIVSELSAFIISGKSYVAYKLETMVTDSINPDYSLPIETETQYFVPYVGFIRGNYEGLWDPFYQQFMLQSSWELIDFKIVKP